MEEECDSPFVAAVTGKLPGNPPPPEKAGWDEQVRKLGISLEEDEEIDLTKTDAEEEEEEEEDDSDMFYDVDYYELLEETGGVPKEKLPGRDEAAPKTDIEKNARDLGVVSTVLNMLYRANKLQAAGIARLQAVVKRSPDLAGLSQLLVPFAGVYVPEVTPHALLPGIPAVQAVVPQQTYTPSQNLVMKPVPGGRQRYTCPVCIEYNLKPGRYQTVQTHINKVHTGLSYGPCKNCNFVSYSQDSWGKHVSSCGKEEK